jgi:hypothetical protein
MGHIKKYNHILVTIIIITGLFAATAIFPLVTSKHTPQQNTLTPDNNNSFGTAAELSNGVEVKGSVNMNDDLYDYFKVNLQRVGRDSDYMYMNISVTDAFGGMLVTFFNPEKYIIGKDVVITSVRNPLLRNIHACYSGYYYIRIEANPIIPINTNYAITVAWSMQRITTDNDNTNDTATPITTSSNFGFMRPESDYLDLFNVTLLVNENSSQGIEATVSDEDNLYLAVFKPDGTLRMMSDFIATDDADDEYIKFAADQNGTYRIAAGVSSAPVFPFLLYWLNLTVVSGIPPDRDYTEELATRVYNGTILNNSFGSDFDVFDFYVIKLNKSDKLTVSILYDDGGPGDLNMEIYELDQNPINATPVRNESKGLWTSAVADKDNTDYYIKVQNQNLSKFVNYTIYFSLVGDNLWFEPMVRNNTNLDFSMLEDGVDMSHVNLNDIFFDPDSTITFSSPSHPTGDGENIDMEILANGTVKFMPHENFYGYERFNFSASDDKAKKLYWEVNVTVVPVNDPPQFEPIVNQVWTQDVPVNMVLTVLDVDNSMFGFDDNSSLFDVDMVNKSINFTPTNKDVGIHHINITATDGQYDTFVNFMAVINNVNDPPTFVSIGNQPAQPNGFVELTVQEDTWNNFSVKVSDPDIEIGIEDSNVFKTNFTDPAFKLDKSTGNISFFPLQKHVNMGWVRVLINVSDNKGGYDLQWLNITVLNINDPPEEPQIVLGYFKELTVNCSVSEVSDEDGDTLIYTWDFGDQTEIIHTGLYANHTYPQPGEYTIRIRVTDGQGGKAEATLDVEVPIEKSSGNGKDNDTDDKNDTKPDTDSDNDNLPDWWEEKYFGNLTYGKNDDVDVDKFTNIEEYKAGTDPTKKTDRPFDDSGKKGEDDEGYTENEDPLSMFYLLGIVVLIVIIIILLFFLFIIRKQRYDDQDVLTGTSTTSGGIDEYDGVEDTDIFYCPECDEEIYEDDLECPNCGYDLEDYDFEGVYEDEGEYEGKDEDDWEWDEEDEYVDDYEDFDYHRRPRVSSRRKFYKRSSKMSTRNDRSRGRGIGRGRTEYEDYDYEDEDEYYEDEDDYYEEDEEDYYEDEDGDYEYEDEEDEEEDEEDEEDEEEDEDEDYEDEREDYITDWH